METRRHALLVDARPDSERRRELAPHGDRRRRFRAGEDDAEHLALVGKLARSRRVDAADLEQRHAGAPVRLVERHGAQQPGAQRRPQHVLVGDERVGDPQHVAVEAGAGELVVGQERRRHHLGDPEPEQHLADAAATLLGRGEVAVQRRQRHALGDVLVAVVAGDLLDDVDLLGRVGSPRRDRHVERLLVAARHGELDRIEQGGDLVAPEVDADDAVDLAAAAPTVERCCGGSDSARASTAPAWTTSSGRRLGQQLDEAGDRRVDAVRVDAPLPSRRGVAAQPGARDAGRDAERFEPGELEGDRRGRVADLAVGAAHDPGEADRTVEGVADQQLRGASACARRRRAWSAASPLRSAEPAPGCRCAARACRQVVGVVRLVELEHHVVADVDDVVDRPLAHRRQAGGHPRRARARR